MSARPSPVVSARKRGCSIDSPAAGLVAEVLDDAADGAERAVGLGARDLDAGVAESDDVGAAVAGGVGQEPRMPVHPPTAGLVAEVC